MFVSAHLLQTINNFSPSWFSFILFWQEKSLSSHLTTLCALKNGANNVK